MEHSTKLRRITYKLKSPNPLFVKWVQEWKDEAEARNIKNKYAFTKALDSLKKFPLCLETGRDCAILKGFNKVLCSMLDDKLREYNKMKIENIKPYTSIECSQIKTNTEIETGVIDNLQTSNMLECIDGVKYDDIRTISCTYTPTFGSPAYAILITLIKSFNNNILEMDKHAIQTNAQYLCDKSFTKPDPGSRHTAWSCMSYLINKKIVLKSGNPAKFSLTEEGIIVAKKLLNKHVDKNTMHDNVINPDEIVENKKRKLKKSEKLDEFSQKISSTIQYDAVVFPANAFEIILLVDTQETSGFTKKAYDETVHELTQYNVPFEIRRLNVGDFLWICRNGTGRELVLPYIIERKRMDDFGSSIRDGRFREQKFRLKNCGVQNLIYLIESHGKNEHTGLPMSTLLQAACNTSAQDGFTIKFTNNHKDSMKYLALITRMFKENISNKILMSSPKENLKKFTFEEDLVALMDFTEFQNISIKTKHFTVQNMFIKHLMQIKGVSVDKAIGIVEKYSTPYNLYREYKEDSLAIKEKLLANIPFGPSKKNIGPAISEVVYQLFTTDIYA